MDAPAAVDENSDKNNFQKVYTGNKGRPKSIRSETQAVKKAEKEKQALEEKERLKSRKEAKEKRAADRAMLDSSKDKEEKCKFLCQYTFFVCDIINPMCTV
jgi:hypothetical protein